MAWIEPGRILTRCAAGAVLLAVPVFPGQEGVRKGESATARNAPVPLGLPPVAGETAPRALVALGERLFFDPILSRDRSVACASCHRPERGFADDRPFSEGVRGQRTRRNAPTLLNRVLGRSFLWDGRARTLEEQVLLPIANPAEMDLSLAEAAERLRGSAYRRDFQTAFGADPSPERLARALAAFVRTLLAGDSPVDRFRSGQRQALSDLERTGLWIFESKGGCWRCHSGPNFTDEGFHNTGVGAANGIPEPGRMAVTGDAADRGSFKTPTLRELTHTAPYMHDGSLATLEDVVAFYRQGGHPNPDLDPDLRPLDLTEPEARALVAFLRALSTDRASDD